MTKLFLAAISAFSLSTMAIELKCNSDDFIKEHYEASLKAYEPELSASNVSTYGKELCELDAETEEFFDLQNDSLEMTNQINNSSYASLIQQYRDKLAAYEEIYSDTLQQTELGCVLSKPVYTRLQMEGTSADWYIYPNPNNGAFHISMGAVPGVLTILNSLGQIIYTGTVSGDQSTITLPHFVPGIYEVILTQGTDVTNQKMVVE